MVFIEPPKPTKIVVDIGGVIRTKNEDASIWSDNYLEAPVVPGAKEGLAFLVRKFGSENVHLVSRCRETIQPRSLAWLEHNGIFELGILQENVHLCVGLEAKIAMIETLQATFVIDDNFEVIERCECSSYLFVTKCGVECWAQISQSW